MYCLIVPSLVMLDMTFQYGETIEVVKHAMTNGSEYTTCKREIYLASENLLVQFLLLFKAFY